MPRAIDIPKCRILSNGQWRGNSALLSKGNPRIPLIPGSKKHTLSHRYIVGSANLEGDISVLS